MAKDRKLKAWERIEALGGHGVWEPDMIVVSLAGLGLRDQDLSLFSDFPDVQILDLSNNELTDNCLKHLEHLESLEELAIVDTNVSAAALKAFKSAHPKVKVRTRAPSKKAINPFTGKPVDFDR